MDKQRYSYTIVNLVLMALAIIMVVINGINQLDAFDAYAAGFMTGGIVMILLLPSIISWVIWRISRRSKWAKTITFNFLISLLILGQVGILARNSTPASDPFSNALEDANEHMEYIQNSQTESVEGFDDVVDEFRELRKKSAKILKNGISEGAQIALSEIVGESTRRDQAWVKAYERLLSTDTFDFERLQKQSFLFAVMKIVDNYEVRSSDFVEHVNKIPEKLAMLLKDNAVEESESEEIVEGFRATFDMTALLTIQIYQLHADYAANLRAPLLFLKEHDDEWSYDTTEEALHFNTDELDTEFWTIFDQLIAEEEEFLAALAPLQQQLMEASKKSIDRANQELDLVQ